MQISIHIYSILVLLALIFSRDLELILKSHSVKLLILLWLYMACIFILSVSGQVHENSMVYFSIGIPLSIFIPLSYLYVRKSYINKPVLPDDSIHIMPGLIFLVSFLMYRRVTLAHPGAFILFFNAFSYVMVIVYTLLLLVILRSSLHLGYFLKQKAGVSESISKKTRKPRRETETRREEDNTLHSEKNRQLQFTEEQIMQLKTGVETEMLTNRPYLRQGYTIADMAKQTAIHLHQLSAFINQYYRMHYNDFINMYRVEYCKKKLLEEESWKYLTLQAIAEESGFGNRNTFTVAFKKITGLTPVEFLKQVKNKKGVAA